MTELVKVKRKRDKSAKRHSILEAAMKVFMEKGYENASMDQISEVAIASKRTVYNHFPCKEDLLRAVLEVFDEEMKLLKNVSYSTHRTLEEQLGEFVDAEIAVVQNKTWMGLIQLLLSVFTSNPDIAKEAMMKHATTESSMTSWMRAAMSDGKLVYGDPVLASRVFSSMLGGAFTWPAVYQGGILFPATLELKNEIIQTFLARYGKITCH